MNRVEQVWVRLVIALFSAITAAAGSVVPSVPMPASAPEHAQAREILSKRYIPVDGSGHVAVRFEDAVRTFSRDDLLDQVQVEYARVLPPGEEPEFVVRCVEPKRYAYSNRQAEHSEILELYRGFTTTQRFDVVYHVTGNRFFGKFQSLIHVGIEPATEESHTAYDVRVYAYPESALPRFFVRHLGLVERYFKGKTRDIEDLATRICTRLIQAPLQLAGSEP